MAVRKKIQKIAIWFFSILLFLILTAVTVSYIYQDKIFKFVTHELGSQINGEVSIEKINLSFLSNFPNISIELHDVIAFSTNNINKTDFNINADTALVAEKIGLAFNPIDFFKENYIVQKIKVEDARINFLLDKKGQHNWNFHKNQIDSVVNDSTHTFIELSAIQLKNTAILYNDKASLIKENSYINNAELSGNVTDSGYIFSIETDMLHNVFSIAGDEYLKNIAVETQFNIEQVENTFILQKATISHDGFTISSEGQVINNPKDVDLDISFNANINDIEEFSLLLPTVVRLSINQLKLDGEITVTGNLKGINSAYKSPALTANVALKNGEITLNDYTYNFSTNGTLASNNVSKLSQYSFTKNSLQFTTGDNAFKGNLSIMNFVDPLLEIEGTFNTKAEVIENLMGIEDYSFEGATNGAVYWKGKTSEFDNLNAQFFDNKNLKINCNLSDWSISAPADSPYEFTDLHGALIIEGRNFIVDSLEGILLNSPFKLKGEMNNFIPALAFENEDALYNLSLSIDQINVDPFVSHYENLPNSESTNSHSGKIKFTSKNFTYDIYNFENVVCTIKFNDNEVSIENAELKTIDGTFQGNTLVQYYADGTAKCSGSGSIMKASAKALFKTFNNFDQNFLTENQLAGIINTTFIYDVILDKNYDPIYNKMKITADFSIEDGTINEFEPFVEMGKKLKVTEFNSVSFKKLVNTIKINADTLYIPNMEIKTNAFDINIGGKHALNNNFVYNLTIYMQKTLSNRFKSKNNMEDFGEIEQNNDGNLKVPLKIFGNPDKYSIDFDIKTSVQNVKQSLEDQKKEWKDILNKPKGDTPPVEEKPIPTEFQIKYD